MKMRVAGIVAEYNPFHNGHRYQIEATRRAGAECVVAVLSGNFVQRGEPALRDKFTRAKAALSCGVDLVLELPLPFAAAGAQRFARGAVALLDALGCVDTLSFGSECGALPPLLQAWLALEDERVRARLRALLKEGQPFAAARQQAVGELFGEDAGALLRQPNNILALEYLGALGSLGSKIEPFTVPRKGAGHDSGAPVGAFASASALRALAVKQGVSALSPYVPAEALACYRGAPVCAPGALELPLLSRLRALAPGELRALPELSEGLEHRLYKAARQARDLGELYALVKSKRYSHARVRRLALAAFLGVRDEDGALPPPYIRVLGYTPAGKELLTASSAALPVGASLRRLQALGGRAQRLALLEAAAGDQYALLCSPRGECGLDYTHPLIRSAGPHDKTCSG